MWIVRLALRRPYTFVVASILLLILGPVSILRTPTDIFPNINIPVISVLWNYTGLDPDQMSTRIVFNYERILTTTVGSYPVPDWLVALPSEQAVIDATRVVIDTQEQAGIDLVCDGELYRFDVNHPETNGMIEYFVRPMSGVRNEIGEQVEDFVAKGHVELSPFFRD